ncbi:hypothetical protein NE619_00255 [Anaerovorax odorimutans]|uniref:Uncharacterized protein n=1 Tax=Anaerovorax odorimutans TaxID=109327 RepID=A0ABT1RJ24_9FIRM|nr:hypothetical protein [Anaerovorax odorimutans]MCQ4635164.1 hypothetical protein [Anaerovorax odorimutans]
MDVMKPATRMVAICLGVIAAVAVILFALSQYLRVDYPVPCQVYGAHPVYAGEEALTMNQELFRIPYIRCKAGKHHIEEISFKEFPQLIMTDVDMPDEEEGDDTRTDYYTLKSVSISLMEDEEPFPGLQEPITLTTATIFYDDDTQQTFDIGKIVLYPQADEAEQVLENNGDTYKDNGAYRASYRTKTDLTLQAFECGPELKDPQLKVNKKEFSDVKDQLIKKDYQLDFALTIGEQPFTFYAPTIRVTCKTSNGRSYTQTLGSFDADIDMYEGPSFFETLSYLKGRGVI